MSTDLKRPEFGTSRAGASTPLPTRVMHGAVAGLILVTFLSFGGPKAAGAQETLRPSPTGYFTRTQDPLITAGSALGVAACALGVPEVCLDPSAIVGGSPVYIREDNYVYVARILGNDDAVGTIGVPLFSVPLGSKIQSLALEFAVDDMLDVGTLLFTPDNPGLMFCLVKDGWAGEDGALWDTQPPRDCSVQSQPVKLREEQLQETTGEGVPRVTTLVRYRVDLMPMARAWAAGQLNNGIMAVPTPDAPDTFEVAFRPPAGGGMTIKVTYDPPPPLAAAPAPDAFDTTEPAAPASFGGDAAPPAEPAPPFTVAEPETEPRRAAAKTGTPWWVYLALPIGFAVLAGMSRGVAQPIRTDQRTKRGPVGRLMERRRQY
ncbi:MAG: hypothetical protein WD646_14280 [Actinomycetota bacterium]